MSLCHRLPGGGAQVVPRGVASFDAALPGYSFHWCFFMSTQPLSRKATPSSVSSARWSGKLGASRPAWLTTRWHLTVRGDASRRNLCHDGENLINQIFVQDFSHRIASVFAFAFKVAGLIADPGSAASPEKHRGKARACQGCLVQLLARAADDSHEFALVINHRKLLELLLCQ